MSIFEKLNYQDVFVDGKINPYALYVRHESEIEDLIDSIYHQAVLSGEDEAEITVGNVPEDLGDDEWAYVVTEANRRFNEYRGK